MFFSNWISSISHQKHDIFQQQMNIKHLVVGLCQLHTALTLTITLQLTLFDT